MSTSPENPAPREEPSEPALPAWWQALDYGLRIACIVVVVWVAWQAVPMLARIFGGGAAPEKGPVAAPQDQAAAPRILAAGPQPGPWRMAGSEWEFALAKLSAPELEERMDKLADRQAASPRPADAAGQDLLIALRALAAPEELSGGRHRYRAASGGWKMTVITQGTGEREAILTGAAAWQSGKSDWQWIELVPRRDQAAADRPLVVAPTEHLLPLIPGATPIASRWSSGGELLLEIVSSPLPFADFEAEWKRQGYRLVSARNVAPQTTPQTTPAFDRHAQAWLCVRGEEVVYLWTTTQGTLTTLLLARTSSADAAGEPPGENPSQPPRESTP